jgi:membrane-associated phospholipid phosphatase
MTHDAPIRRNQGFRAILNQTFVALAACVFAVVVCYYFVDRQVAFFVHNHGVNKHDFWKWLTYPPPLVQTWSPLALVLLAVRRAWGPWRRWQQVLFLACLSLIIADQFRFTLGNAAGRYWPETWHDNNPSLIGDSAYGFHPFHADDDEGSFPSGHAARIVGFLSVFWFALPRSRWLYAMLALPMLAALVAMNYHFVGDVIAGSVLGGIIGAWAVRLGGLDDDPVARRAQI